MLNKCISSFIYGVVFVLDHNCKKKKKKKKMQALLNIFLLS